MQAFRDRLRGTSTSKKVTTDYVDPDKKREVAQQNQVRRAGRS